MPTQHASIFDKYVIDLAIPSELGESFPLKEHSQIPYIIDVLSRKQQHHVLLQGLFAEKIQQAFMRSITLHAMSPRAPQKLRNACFIYFDSHRFQLGNEKSKQVTQDFMTLCEKNIEEEKHIIFITHDSSLLQSTATNDGFSTLSELLIPKLHDEQWHFITFASCHHAFFSTIRLKQPSEKETLDILKCYKEDIENFHDITMSDDVFQYALSLASHYLGGESHFNKALELLDSSAARASTLERNDPTVRPLLTTSILSHVVSHWTHVPLSHLHHNKFKLTKFLHYIQQRVFGQDMATNTVGTLLQSTCIKFKNNPGPIFNLLLTGPSGVGKKEFALALTEYLFATPEALLKVNLNKQDTISSLSDIMVTIQSDKTHKINILEAIQSKPYAVVLFENFHEAPAVAVNLLKDIFISGFGLDANGNHYDFRHAIIIITTTLGAEHITAKAKQQTETSGTQAMDLMQLVLNENTHNLSMYQSLSPADIREHIIPELQTFFSSDMLRHSHIIPFIPLDQTSLEKIVKLRLTALSKSLEEEFGIELSYANEVIKFLAYEAVKHNENSQTLIKLFEQHVNANIASEILSRIDDKNRPKRIALLLNESGQLLRCEFITTHEATLYAI